MSNLFLFGYFAMHPWAVLVLAAVLSPGAHAYESDTDPVNASRYTFSWPLGENTLKPRGASTIGAPVTLDTAPSLAWRELQQSGLGDQERDRRAILAMAGPYRVTFDFLEVARFDPALPADAPYQSWGTEYVFVSEDRDDFIALQHVLVMRVVQQDGSTSEPFVTRHWRQEWRYEAATAMQYQGSDTWALKSIAQSSRRGAWVQSVYQVDDSPRYAARGRWQHNDSFSTWISDETWRPLPRREWSVRKDYQVLAGTNRHTVTATGWVQEENNLKLALDSQGDVRASRPYLAREYGVARYQRIKDFDFSAGRDYFEKTEPFWAEVRAAWREIARRGRFTLAQPVDQGQLFVPFFEYAENLADGAPFAVEDARAFIRRTLQEKYLAPA